MNRLIAALFVGALGLMAQGAAASDFVVLESNVASFAPGSVIPGAQKVQLAGGARLVMIASDGIPFKDGKGHPRGAGCFSRVLAHYCREKGLLSLHRALSKL
ncbi:MAG: hypothetical protein VX463_10315, partial [Pseudomonadota bacterium]|nr:hypothetical protein [Pseudomonadota bacterium]